MVLDIGKEEGPRPKCYLYHGHLPSYIDSAHPPTKKEPFRTVAEQRTSHTLDLLLPLHRGTEKDEGLFNNASSVLRYSKVYMKLGELLTGDFFNEYIKKGNIMMLAEGRPGNDHTFALTDGVLRLEVDRATFEKSGLEGKAISSEGRKHVKARYAIEANLRLPSMVHGKKGFERVVWACKNVFDHSLAWLFCDLNAAASAEGSISVHAPTIRTVEPSVRTIDGVVRPKFPDTFSQEDEEDASDLLEWLSLVTSGSPRVFETDRVDQYICRYHVPVLDIADEASETPHTSCTLMHYHWHGFMPSEFVTKILLNVLKASGDDWFAMSAASFDSHRYTTLKHKNLVTTWKYAE